MNTRLALLVVASLAAAMAVTIAQGTPSPLPGVALGSSVLLHAERAAALLALVVAVLTVLVEAARGRLPTEFSTSGVGYGPRGLRDDNAAAADLLQDQVAELQDAIAALTDAPDEPTNPW